ncbi:class I SAM-dependent methyltransferase [Mycetocola sp. JXN-3]|uniref:class I SAM-dependent methyltransferase n=1 Tax=Mycetocola sp. JXN-3 TaxID=2116510 RepID=UPI00165D2B71|nr:class I SAM-dependent methyltransferase [Mycetocola sp. JXN-3]
MDRNELLELLTPEGLRLLDDLAQEPAGADPVTRVSRLRAQGHAPALVSAALTQDRLRRKAVGKFGEFAERMLFTQAGLEQATRLRVAALHAGRFRALAPDHLIDLGCGIGGDALAAAAIGLRVTAVDRDEVTATLASYNLAPFENADVLNASAEDVDLDPYDAIYLDPARRTSGHSNTTRLTRASDYSPSLDFAFGLAETRAVGIKLGPGFDREDIPEGWEAQWITVDGQVVELGLWSPRLARPGITRAALVLNDAGSHEMTAAADSADVEVRELGEYLYEPDGSVIRARLIGDLARELGAGMLSPGIAYLTGDSAVETPFAARFRILERFTLDEKKLKRELKARGIGTLEVKKRGVDIDPATFRKKMSLSGKNTATLFLTRIDGQHAALLAERA